jgi:hypothetical protein
MRYRVFLPLVAVALSTALPAAADGTDPAAAAALFQEGRDAAKRGDYASACPKLADSYRLDPAPGTLLNLADCNEHLGKLASAWQLFQQAAEHLTPTDTRMPVAKQRIAALEARLPRLAVSLSADAPPGTKVTRDAVELGGGSLNTALPVDPGEHVVVATAPDREDRRYTVKVEQGKTERLVVEPGDPVVRSPAPKEKGQAPDVVAPQGPTGLGKVGTVGIVVGAVGLAGLGVAIGTGLMLPGKQSIVDAHCGSDNLCDKIGYEAATGGKTLAAVNTAMWFVGGIVTGVGVALVIVGGAGGGSGRDADPKPRAALHVGPLPGGAGASFGGTF